MSNREFTDRFMSALKDSYYGNKAGVPTDFLRGECRLLSYISHDKSRKYQPKELSKRLGLTTARIASILKTLEKKGLIIREGSPDDKRSVLISITDEGIEYINKKREDSCLFFDKLFEKLTEDECGELLRIIRKLTEE